MDALHPVAKEPIESCRDIFQVAAGKGSGVVLYRGQDVDKALLPKIARLARDLDWDYPDLYESRLLEMFRRVGAPHLNLSFLEPEFRFLSVARHYGLPTRLLDWTENPFIALWFAVEKRKGPDDKGNSFLYVYRVADNDIEYDPDGETLGGFDTGGKVKVFQPFHIDPRIAAQAAWFSIHPYRHKAKEYLPLSRLQVEGTVTRYWVSSNSVTAIREELLNIGISPATLFPDLAGLSDALELQVKLNKLHVPKPSPGA